jgi:hypothetical protein
MTVPVIISPVKHPEQRNDFKRSLNAKSGWSFINDQPLNSITRSGYLFLDKNHLADRTGTVSVDKTEE